MITIYTTNWCSYCVAAKQFLKENNLDYEEINIEKNNMTRQDLEKLSGNYTVPQIFINDKCIGGYDQLISLYQNDELKDLLYE